MYDINPNIKYVNVWSIDISDPFYQNNIQLQTVTNQLDIISGT